MLTRLYQDAFVLVGVVCDEPARLLRLQNDEFKDAKAGRTSLENFMKRDAKEGPKVVKDEVIDGALEKALRDSSRPFRVTIALGTW